MLGGTLRQYSPGLEGADALEKPPSRIVKGDWIGDIGCKLVKSFLSLYAFGYNRLQVFGPWNFGIFEGCNIFWIAWMYLEPVLPTGSVPGCIVEMLSQLTTKRCMENGLFFDPAEVYLPAISWMWSKRVVQAAICTISLHCAILLFIPGVSVYVVKKTC